jgi:hypothetical protein
MACQFFAAVRAYLVQIRHHASGRSYRTPTGLADMARNLQGTSANLLSSAVRIYAQDARVAGEDPGMFGKADGGSPEVAFSRAVKVASLESKIAAAQKALIKPGQSEGNWPRGARIWRNCRRRWASCKQSRNSESSRHAGVWRRALWSSTHTDTGGLCASLEACQGLRRRFYAGSPSGELGVW